MNTKTITDYLWLVVGCLCLWIGLKALYYVYAFDSPQSLSGLLFVAPFCFYRFAKLRRAAHRANN